jgi:ferrous iron transport protein A
MDSLLETQIGGYRLKRLLASGGMAAVFEAENIHTGAHAAVKVLRRGWWSGPIHLRVGMTELMLRRVDAAHVEVLAGDGSHGHP